MKWEYAVIYLTSSDSPIDDLNEFGKMGWEMIAVDNGMIYFKKTLGVEFSQEIVAGASVEEMVDIMDEAMSKLTKGRASG